MRDSRIYISKENLIHNYNVIKNYANNREIAPVIKANAFGHGLELCGKVYQEIGNRIVTVAYLNEAVKLRESGYINDILILVPPVEKDVNFIVDYSLETTIAEIHTAKKINDYAKSKGILIKIHIFINTGMNREGIRPSNINDFLEDLLMLKNLKVVGILSHFVAGDIEDNMFNHHQIRELKQAVAISTKQGISFDKIHIHNSASIFNYPDNNSYFNFYRPGIASYGLLPDSKTAINVGLKPVLSLKTKIHHIIPVRRGQTCGYSFAYYAEKDTVLGVIPIGYGDGLRRDLSDKMEVLIKGKRYKVAGYISMDLIIIDLENDEINQGDDVTIIGSNGSDQITVYELAEKLKTIPYEITTQLSERLPRVLV